MKKRFCKECKKIINGRIDQKFCSGDCRTSYHNKEYRANYIAILKINKILKNNYRILARLHSKEDKEWPCSSLFDLGFNFDYFTSIDSNTIPNQSLKMYCYDYSYTILDQKNIVIKKESKIFLPQV